VFGINESGPSGEEWLRFYESVERELFPLMMSPTRMWVSQHFAPLLAEPHFLDHRPCVIHDDLAQYHILLDKSTWRLSGIIDFGTTRLGDPAADYGMLINVYGESFVARLAEHVPFITESIDRARFYAGVLELQWLRGGVRAQDFSWLTAHLDRARDVQPIGAPLNGQLGK
jgi:aminoglycoside 2''-phosphotransferase